ncbi:hypothetical protein GE09DRAFT_1078145 [Coniochaeta sp. 2T2.1]|nr:hypothetical protein GE09DRAFT_1078145 [Coniochaeta sp. 2T2.1]
MFFSPSPLFAPLLHCFLAFSPTSPQHHPSTTFFTLSNPSPPLPLQLPPPLPYSLFHRFSHPFLPRVTANHIFPHFAKPPAQIQVLVSSTQGIHRGGTLCKASAGRKRSEHGVRMAQSVTLFSHWVFNEDRGFLMSGITLAVF